MIFLLGRMLVLCTVYTERNFTSICSKPGLYSIWHTLDIEKNAEIQFRSCANKTPPYKQATEELYKILY